MQSLSCKVALLSILLAFFVNSQGLPFYFDPLGNIGGASFTPLSLNPVSWWQGNGNALDSASTNNGTWAGTTSYATGRDSRQAFSLNGSSRVEIGFPQNLALSNSITLSVWIKTSTFDTFRTIFGAGVLGAVDGYGIFVQSGGVAYQRRIVSGNSLISYSTTSTNWTMLTSVETVTGRSLYINGTYVTNAVATFTKPPNKPWGIGQTYIGSSWAFGFSGIAQDAMVFNRALTQEEITQLYNWKQ